MGEEYGIFYLLYISADIGTHHAFLKKNVLFAHFCIVFNLSEKAALGIFII